MQEATTSTEPKWEPLENAVGKDNCSAFMFMFRKEFNGKTICAFKYYNTRKYLFIDTEGNFYSFNGQGQNNDYTPIEREKALQYVYSVN